MITSTETCANCGDQIGELETAHIWQGNVVCTKCNGKLAASVSSAPKMEEPLSYSPLMAVQRMPRDDEIICPNPQCKYVGLPKKKSKGSWGMAIFLLLLGGFPGILYILLYNGYQIVCPRCGMKIRDET